MEAQNTTRDWKGSGEAEIPMWAALLQMMLVPVGPLVLDPVHTYLYDINSCKIIIIVVCVRVHVCLCAYVPSCMCKSRRQFPGIISFLPLRVMETKFTSLSVCSE